MGPYGSVGAHIKTGRSPMAQYHFKAPPDPKKGHGIIKIRKKKKSRAGQEINQKRNAPSLSNDCAVCPGMLKLAVLNLGFCLMIS